MQFRCSFQLPVLFQSSIEDESCSEVHPGFPEFPGSRQGLSRLVNISSIYGLVSDPTGGTFSYSASKGGVRLLSKSAALHCAREGYGIRVNTIHPGFINTPLATKYFENAADPDAELAAFTGRHPMGRFGEPEEIALAALYLLSDESAFVTGTEIVVDGGYTAV